MTTPEEFRKMAEVVESIQEIEGLSIEENEISDVPTGEYVGDLMEAVMSGEDPEQFIETEKRIVLQISFDGESDDQEISDDGDEDPTDPTEIPLED